MKRRSLPALALIVLVLPGCYAMNIDARALEPHVYLSPAGQPGSSPQRVGEFEVDLTTSWVLFGFVPLKNADVGEALQREITRANGTAVTGLEIKTQQTFIDGLLTVITFNLYGQRTTMVTGTVVR